MYAILSRFGPLSLTFALVLGVSSLRGSIDEKDAAQIPVDVYEWSLWVGNPAQTTVNTSRIYKNAMPGVVGTSRIKFEEKELATKFPIAPISIVQFFGEP